MRKADRLRFLATTVSMGINCGIATQQRLVKELRSQPASSSPAHIEAEIKDKAEAKRLRKAQKRLNQFGMTSNLK